MTTKEYVWEQVKYCRNFEEVCRKCKYHKKGECNSIFDLLEKVDIVLEVCICGVANN